MIWFGSSPSFLLVNACNLFRCRFGGRCCRGSFEGSPMRIDSYAAFRWQLKQAGSAKKLQCSLSLLCIRDVLVGFLLSAYRFFRCSRAWVGVTRLGCQKFGVDKDTQDYARDAKIKVSYQNCRKIRETA